MVHHLVNSPVLPPKNKLTGTRNSYSCFKLTKCIFNFGNTIKSFFIFILQNKSLETKNKNNYQTEPKNMSVMNHFMVLMVSRINGNYEII